MPPDFTSLLTLAAPAKVNLYLRVVGRRDDGYHDLVTWMQKLNLCDVITLRLKRRPGILLSCDDLPADAGNLAWKGAEAVLRQSRHGGAVGVEIQLIKHIPVAAGLGGGSSDAGTVMRGLNRLLGNEFSEEKLVSLARSVGADVPFFASEHDAVWATGIGDVMEPIATLGQHIFILINPGFAVSTKAVFESFALTPMVNTSILPGSLVTGEIPLSFAEMTNDLERVTCREYPVIEEMREDLLNAGAVVALMSGSGPTVFGVFEDAYFADPAVLADTVARLRQRYNDRVFVARARAGA